MKIIDLRFHIIFHMLVHCYNAVIYVGSQRRSAFFFLDKAPS